MGWFAQQERRNLQGRPGIGGGHGELGDEIGIGAVAPVGFVLFGEKIAEGGKGGIQGPGAGGQVAIDEAESDAEDLLVIALIEMRGGAEGEVGRVIQFGFGGAVSPTALVDAVRVGD